MMGAALSEGPCGVLQGIEALEDLPFDAALVGRLSEECTAWLSRPLQASTPGFMTYDEESLAPCDKRRFRAFSITGPACALDCDHCQAKILEPMLPATKPDIFEHQVRGFIEREGLQGFLLSGGSSRANQVPFERYMPVIERLKRDHPRLRVAVHTGLADERRARLLAAAQVDAAMIDIIGHDDTIRQVYHLNASWEDFAASLGHLCAAGVPVVPHIVLGLHYGRLLGEWRALDIIAAQPVAAVILVVIMPQYTRAGLFSQPEAAAIGEFFAAARARLADRRVLLGCARPAGVYRRVIDAYAVLAGLDGIAFPAPGAVALARRLGRPVVQSQACCSLSCAAS